VRCPTLTELPSSPPGKTGWPWTEEGEQLPDTMPSGKPWPRVSIVTPSYNQGQFIEETIRSVLLQGYPNLEYIIIDGGSTDGSVDIIRKYEPWLMYWVSEPDAGQADAINKGFAKATGDMIAWLNSDDCYVNGALRLVGETVVRCPGGDVIHGHAQFIDEHSRVMRFNRTRPHDLKMLMQKQGMPAAQPSIFTRRSWLDEVGYLNPRWHYAFDLAFFMSIALAGAHFQMLDEVLGQFRVHPASKTSTQPIHFGQERLRIIETLLERYGVPAGCDRQQILARAYMHKARSELVGQDFAQARRSWRQALALYPKEGASRMGLAVGLQALLGRQFFWVGD